MPTMLDEIRGRLSATAHARRYVGRFIGARDDAIHENPAVMGKLMAELAEHDAQDAAMLRVVEAAAKVPEDVWMVILRGLLHAEGYSDDERAGMMSLVVGLHQATSALTVETNTPGGRPGGTIHIGKVVRGEPPRWDEEEGKDADN